MIRYPGDLIENLDHLRAYDPQAKNRLKADIHWRHFEDLYFPYPVKFLDQIDCGIDGPIFIKNGLKDLREFFKQNRPKNEPHILILGPSARSVVPKAWAKSVKYYKIQDQRPKATKDFIISNDGPNLRDVKSLHDFNIVMKHDPELIGFSSLKLMAIYKLGRFSDWNPEKNPVVERMVLSPYHKLVITE